MKQILKIGLYIFLIASICYSVIFLINFSKKRKTASNREWTDSDKETMIKACVVTAKNSYKDDPIGTEKLCECAAENIMANYTYDQYVELDKKSEEEKEQEVKPIVMKCRDSLSSK